MVSSKGRPGRRSWGSVRRLPSGRWQARYWDSGQGQSIAAPQTFESKTSADAWLSQKRTDLSRGLAVDDRAALRPVRDWWPAYRQTLDVLGLRASTILLYEQAWRRIEPELGGIAVSRLAPSRIEEWIAKLVASGLSATKVREAVGVLRRVLDLAVSDGALTRNPCSERRLALPRTVAKERVMLPAEEVARLLACVPMLRDRALFKVLVYGGLRIGEVLALRRRDVDLERGRLEVSLSVSTVNGTTGTKTGRSRSIVLPASVTADLRDLMATTIASPDHPVFASRSGRERMYRNFRRDTWDPVIAAYNADREARGLEPLALRPHDLRSICASLLVDAGASVKDVQEHLGHADVTTTLRIYARVNPDKATDIARRLDAMVQEVGLPVPLAAPVPIEPTSIHHRSTLKGTA